MTCAFGPCTCTVDEKDPYCAPSCRMGISDRGEACKCGHADCSATTGKG
jgi:hypothetical protein